MKNLNTLNNGFFNDLLNLSLSNLLFLDSTNCLSIQGLFGITLLLFLYTINKNINTQQLRENNIVANSYFVFFILNGLNFFIIKYINTKNSISVKKTK